jgi:membrane protein implicated in regulation of membrane protease activity
MSKFHPSRFMRVSLIGDAAASGATGLLLLIGAGVLSGLLDLPEALMRWAGITLLPYAALILYLGSRDTLSSSAVWAVIGTNLIWAAASILLLLMDLISPNGLGLAFVLFQAAVVAGFAEAQFMSLRRSASSRMAEAM